MDLINEFAFILSKNKPAEFNAALPANSKIRKLYDLIISKQVKNDDEASKTIYNSTKADKKYLMLKRNLVQKLSELVYLHNYEEVETDNYMNIHFQVEKELLIAEKLLLKNVYHNPTKIIAKVEQTAEKYYFIDIQVSAARKFRSVFSLKGFPKETAEYDEKVKRLTKFQNYYTDARGMWEKLYSKTKYTSSVSEAVINDCTEALDKIGSWLKFYDSPFMKLYFYKIGILLNHQKNNQNQILKYLKQISQLISDYPFINTKSLQLDINYYYARYYRDTKQIEQAQKQIETCLEISDYRAFDKFLIQELSFDIQLKKGDYLQAGKIITEVLSVPQYQFLNNYDKAAWVIREAYIFFIYKALGKNEEIALLPLFSKPKSLHYFLEKSKKWSKDKYGYNVALLIIRVLLYKINELEDVESEGSNMLVYYHRYLKPIQTRTSIFFYQLAKAILQSCTEDVLLNRQQKLLNQFHELNESSYDSFEMIPYETFWELIMSFYLKRNQI